MVVAAVNAQTISSRSNEVALDFSSGKSKDGAIPSITWLSPETEVTFMKEGKVNITLTVESTQTLKSVTLTVRDKDTGNTRGTLPLKINGAKNLSTKLNQNITLTDGITELEVLAETENGQKSVARRQVHVGATLMADAAKLNRKDYALIIATDKYDNWTSLVNPVFDAHTIENQLKTNFGFQTDVVETPQKNSCLLS